MKNFEIPSIEKIEINGNVITASGETCNLCAPDCTGVCKPQTPQTPVE